MSDQFAGGGGGGSVSPITNFSPWGGMQALASVGALSGANKVQVSGFYLPNSITLNNIVVSVNASDAGNNYDWGIYDSSGNLKAHVGAHAVGATGIVDLAVVGAPVTLSAGKYYFAFTGAAVTAQLGRGPTGTTLVSTFASLVESATTSSGGALPATATMPADSWAQVGTVHGFTLH